MKYSGFRFQSALEDVLAVYAVKGKYRFGDPQVVANLTEEKKELLRGVFGI